MSSRTRPWREAATVLLAAGGGGWRPRPPCAFDYQVLLMRRSAKSAFMPEAHVFPGGVVDEADFSPAWAELLPKAPRCGLRSAGEGPPPLFAAQRSASALPRDVAFRIGAIRETFEESGLLLLVPGGPGAPPAAGPARLLPAERLPTAAELAEWRRRVQRQPGSFLELCRRLGCLPNLWALHEWSRWLTPAGQAEHGWRRFDTTFYLCCLAQEPPVAAHDQKEMTAYQWSTPLEIVERFNAQDIRIAPPQLYELSRLCQFSSLHDLHRFGSERALEGCEHWMPVLIIASDGHMHLLPGDDLYPEDPDFIGERKPVLNTNKTIEEIMKETKRFHRVVIPNDSNVTVHVNIKPKYKHINPKEMNFKMGNNTDHNNKL